MEFTDFLSPIDISKINDGVSYATNTIGSLIRNYSVGKNFPELKKLNLAIVGVEEQSRAFNNEGCSAAPDAVRKYLYNLYRGGYEIKIADLGNIKQGNTVDDTYFAVKSVTHQLLKKPKSIKLNTYLKLRQVLNLV